MEDLLGDHFLVRMRLLKKERKEMKVLRFSRQTSRLGVNSHHSEHFARVTANFAPFNVMILGVRASCRLWISLDMKAGLR